MLNGLDVNDNLTHIRHVAPHRRGNTMEENRTARLTVLIDPNKKAAFEALCREEDVTPSQMVRKLIRDYIESRLGPDWREQVLGRGE